MAQGASPDSSAAAKLIAAYATGMRSFQYWNLSNADLKNANLKDANFLGANFRGADLSGADLTRCNFAGADLTSANMRGANIGEASFQNALTIGTIMSDTVGSPVSAPPPQPTMSRPATKQPAVSATVARPAIQQGGHASRQTPEHARQVITGSWVFTGIVGSFISLILLITAVTPPNRTYDYYTNTYVTGSAPTGLLLLIPVAYFCAWALFWGWGPVWRGWKEMMRGIGCPFIVAPAAFFLLFFLVIGAIALVYGALSGFSRYSEAKRTAQGLA